MRLGVVLLLRPPLDAEIDAFRRAVGDGTLGRVPPHLTLVPPVNVRDDRLDDALRVLREAAATTRPFLATLGPPTTFLPNNPVLYLPIDPDAAKSVVVLREKVFREPLARPLTWPFVPHVTIGDEVAPERIAAAELALSDYRTEVTFDRVHLLREGEGRVWGPIADARFGGPAVVGRGGLPVELAVTDSLDPESLRFVEREWDSYWLNQIGSLSRKADFNVVARREGTVVGVAQGWVRGHVGYLEDLIVAQPERGTGVGSRLLDAFVFESAQRGCDRVMLSTWEGTEAEAIYRRKGWVEEARFDYWVAGRKMIRLSRNI